MIAENLALNPAPCRVSRLLPLAEKKSQGPEGNRTLASKDCGLLQLAYQLGPKMLVLSYGLQAARSRSWQRCWCKTRC